MKHVIYKHVEQQGSEYRSLRNNLFDDSPFTPTSLNLYFLKPITKIAAEEITSIKA